MSDKGLRRSFFKCSPSVLFIMTVYCLLHSFFFTTVYSPTPSRHNFKVVTDLFDGGRVMKMENGKIIETTNWVANDSEWTGHRSATALKPSQSQLFNVNAAALSNSSTWDRVVYRNRTSSLFMAAEVSPVSSSSDRADVRLQGYQKPYSHQQQVFTQQQGGVSICICVTAFVFLFLCLIVSSVSSGCLYGEGKVAQPVSDGGFEPASYFTNPSTSHSTGNSARVFLSLLNVHCCLIRKRHFKHLRFSYCGCAETKKHMWLCFRRVLSAGEQTDFLTKPTGWFCFCCQRPVWYVFLTELASSCILDVIRIGFIFLLVLDWSFPLRCSLSVSNQCATNLVIWLATKERLIDRFYY